MLTFWYMSKRYCKRLTFSYDMGMNELRTYLNCLPTPEQEQLAIRCGTTIGYLRKALSTGQVLREKLCAALERESQGRVTRLGLRPADCYDIWPELAQTHANTTQAAINYVAQKA